MLAVLRKPHVWVWAALLAFIGVKNLAAPGQHSVYPRYAQAAWELDAGEAPVVDYSFQHLPYFAGVIVAPFAAFPDRAGGLFWAFASLAVLATGLRAVAVRFAPANSRAVAAVLIVAPLVGVGSLGNNQSNILITGCLCWGAALVHDRRWWAAAAVLAVPGFKLYPLALGLVYAALHPRAFAGRFAIAVAACIALPFLIYPADPVLDRLAAVWQYLASGIHYQEYEFMGVREFLGQYGLVLSPATYFPVQTAAGSVIPFLLWRLRRTRADARTVNARACELTALWFVTFGPSIEPQTYLLAGPAFGFLVAAGLRGELSRAGLGLVIAAAMLAGPLQTDLLGREARIALTGSKLACLGMTLVFVYRLAATTRDIFSAASAVHRIGYARRNACPRRPSLSFASH